MNYTEKEFTNREKVIKGFKASLIPSEQTERFMSDNNITIDDLVHNDIHRGEMISQLKEECSVLICKILDDSYESFKNILTSVEFDTLYSYIINEPKDKDSKKEYKKLSEKFINGISAILSEHPLSKIFTSGSLKKFVESDWCSDELKEVFSKNTTNYKNRIEAYSTILTGKKTGSIAFRTFENYKLFIKNCHKFWGMDEDVRYETSMMCSLNDVKCFFNEYDWWKFVVTQSGIDEYNMMLRGYADGDNIVRGFNGVMNEVAQKLDLKVKKLKYCKLDKQITSDEKDSNDVRKVISNEEEFFESVDEFFDEFDCADLSDRVKCITTLMNSAGADSVIVNSKHNADLSKTVFGEWNVISYKIKDYAYEHFTKKGDIKNFLKNNYNHSLSECGVSLDSIINEFDSCVDELSVCVEDFYDEWFIVESVARDSRCGDYSTTQDKDLKSCMKKMFNAFTRLSRFLSCFIIDENDEDDEMMELIVDMSKELKQIQKTNNLMTSYLTKNCADITKKCGTVSLEVASGINTMYKKNDDVKDCVMFDGDKMLYAIINNTDTKPDKNFKDIDTSVNNGGETFKAILIQNITKPNRNFTNWFISCGKAEQYNPSDRIKFIAKKSGKDLTVDEVSELVDYYKKCAHIMYPNMHFEFRDKYEKIDDFYKDVECSAYGFLDVRISKDYILKLADEGKIFLFDIVTKDSRPGSHGNMDMQTIYFKSVFSEENLKDLIITLNNKFVLGYRSSCGHNIKNAVVHKAGEVMLNKKDKTGVTIPYDIRCEILEHINGKKSYDELSVFAKEYIDNDNYTTTVKEYDIVKDRRYYNSNLTINFTINCNAYQPSFSDNPSMLYDFNDVVKEKLKKESVINVISIDLGVVHPVSYVVRRVSRDGKIDEVIKTGNLDYLNGNNMAKVMKELKKIQRNKQRTEMTACNIKNNQSGYASEVAKKIADMVIEYGAIVVFENLNSGFRVTNREKGAIWNKIIQALFKKLSYLVYKNVDINEPGGARRAYQLTTNIDLTDFNNRHCTQNGVVFFENPCYTSCEDPITKFAPAIPMSDNTVAEQTDFISNFDFIKYSEEDDMFMFRTDFSKFDCKCKRYADKVYDIYSYGNRYDSNGMLYSITEEIKKCLEYCNVDYKSRCDIKSQILKNENGCVSKFYDLFYKVKKTRITNRQDNVDYVVSLVKDENGRFYDVSKETIPGVTDSDINGAYNVGVRFIERWISMEM